MQRKQNKKEIRRAGLSDRDDDGRPKNRAKSWDDGKSHSQSRKQIKRELRNKDFKNDD